MSTMHGRQARTFDGVDYVPGAKYEVLVPGLRLSGWIPIHGGAQGWGQQLQPGDVITCLGYGPGWGSDPGYGIEWTSEAAKAAHAYSLDIWPTAGGAFDYRPPAGSVRRLPEEN
jgi:hypothetical protein